MISTPGHWGLRRRQRRSLPAWFSRWPALSGGGNRIETLKAIRAKMKAGAGARASTTAAAGERGKETSRALG
jgi:hypothetical protein